MENIKKDLKGFEVDVKINAYYDYDLTQIYFEDNFEAIDNRESLYFYGEKSIVDIIEDGMIKLKKDDLLLMVTDGEVTKRNKKEEIINYINDNYSFLDKLKSFYSFLNLDYIVTRGYSQGDYARVYFLKDDKFEGFGGFVDQIFWDCPVLVSCEVEFFKEDADGFKKSFNVDLEIMDYLEDNYDIETINFKDVLKYELSKYDLDQDQIDAIRNRITSLTYNDVKSR